MSRAPRRYRKRSPDTFGHARTISEVNADIRSLAAWLAGGVDTIRDEPLMEKAIAFHTSVGEGKKHIICRGNLRFTWQSGSAPWIKVYYDERPPELIASTGTGTINFATGYPGRPAYTEKPITVLTPANLPGPRVPVPLVWGVYQYPGLTPDQEREFFYIFLVHGTLSAAEASVVFIWNWIAMGRGEGE